MGIGCCFTRDSAQAETLRVIDAGRLQLAIIKHQTFGLPLFDEQLAIIGPMQRIAAPVVASCDRLRSWRDIMERVESGMGHASVLC